MDKTVAMITNLNDSSEHNEVTNSNLVELVGKVRVIYSD